MKAKSLIKIKDIPYIYLDIYMFGGEIDEVITNIRNILVNLAAAIKKLNLSILIIK